MAGRNWLPSGATEAPTRGRWATEPAVYSSPTLPVPQPGLVLRPRARAGLFRQRPGSQPSQTEHPSGMRLRGSSTYPPHRGRPPPGPPRALCGSWATQSLLQLETITWGPHSSPSAFRKPPAVAGCQTPRCFGKSPRAPAHRCLTPIGCAGIPVSGLPCLRLRTPGEGEPPRPS